MTDADRAEGLREWACGLYGYEAAAELLIRACGGRFLQGPWVKYDADRGRYWFDPSVAIEESGYLSGGERRVLAIAASLVSSEHPVDLGDVSGLDRQALSLVLAALAHAGGSHEHSRMLMEEGPDGRPVYVGSERLDSIYGWPEEEPE